LSAPRRLELLDLLGQAPRTVEGLAEQTGMSVANTSQHLQVLRAAGLVDTRRSGRETLCRLRSEAFEAFAARERTILGLGPVADPSRAAS